MPGGWIDRGEGAKRGKRKKNKNKERERRSFITKERERERERERESEREREKCPRADDTLTVEVGRCFFLTLAPPARATEIP